MLPDDVDYDEEVPTAGDQMSSSSYSENAPTRLLRVSIADVFTNPPDDQVYIWGGRIPVGHQTLLSAHGGVGKTQFSLELAIHTSLGANFLGLPTKKTKVLFFSAEDNEKTIRRRIAKIC